MTMPNHEPLTPEQLFALCESNARAIEALANAVAEDRERNTIELAETRVIMRQGFQAAAAENLRLSQNIDRVERTVETLAQSVDRYFAGQANQNRLVSGALEGYETRIIQLEGGQTP